ncbi:hypothetical protein FE275_01530 [Pseudomonas koreensis]|nr:hypothetical protein FE275_01530 [Pseudomonas koreensis]
MITIPCGSEPARESGVSFNTALTDPSPSRAGSLPHWFIAYAGFCRTKNPPISPAAPLNRISNAGNTPLVTMR